MLKVLAYFADLGWLRFYSLFGFRMVQVTENMKNRLSSDDISVINHLSLDSRTLQTMRIEINGYYDSLLNLKEAYMSNNAVKSNLLSTVLVTPKNVEKPPVEVKDLGITLDEWNKEWANEQKILAGKLNRNPNISADSLVITEKELSHVELCCSDRVFDALQLVLDSHQIIGNVAIKKIDI